jgi:hypothetical protein
LDLRIDPLRRRYSHGGSASWQRWAGEPLLHFLVIGIAIFLLFATLDDQPAVQSVEQIVVGENQAVRLAEQFAAVWRRPPTVDELSGLIDEQIREEVYVREALALNLDRDDAVIRQRLRQKMMFLTDSAVAGLEPDQAELRAFFEAAEPGRFTPPPRIAFRQVFLGEAPRDAAVARLEDSLATGADPALLGVPTLLPAEMPLAAPATVDGTFGPGFFERLTGLPVGTWEGPLPSSYGLHLVHVDRIERAERPPFETVRERVLTEWRGERAAELADAAFERMRARYEISRPDASTLRQVLQ